MKKLTIKQAKDIMKNWIDETYRRINDYTSYLDMVIQWATVVDKVVMEKKPIKLYMDDEGLLCYKEKGEYKYE